jgi:hypothetical protein
VGFEPTIPVFERVKTVHALDRAAIVIVTVKYIIVKLLTHSSSGTEISPKLQWDSTFVVRERADAHANKHILTFYRKTRTNCKT